MKLSEIKDVNGNRITEGVIPVHIAMTLDQIIRDGEITNNVQYFILAGLISMFKDGGPKQWPREINPTSMGVSAEQIDAVKSLTGPEAVELAKWVGNELQKPATYELRSCCDGPEDTLEWVRYVISKQD